MYSIYSISCDVAWLAWKMMQLRWLLTIPSVSFYMKILSQNFLFEIHSFTTHHDLNFNTVLSSSSFRWFGLSIEFNSKSMSNLSRSWESKYIQVSDGDLIIWGLTLVEHLPLMPDNRAMLSFCFINTLQRIHQVTIPPFTATCSTCKGSGRVIKVLILIQWTTL